MNDSGCYTLSKCREAYISTNYNRHLLDIEKNFNGCFALEILNPKWKICFYVVPAYLVAIFAGRHLMKNRAPFQLRGALICWNAVLAAISIFCAVRSVSAMLYLIHLDGFYSTVCGTSFSKQQQSSMALYIAFSANLKFLELGDTVFIVLRKRPLIVLHWFHHATVVFFAWSCIAYPSTTSQYFVTMNYFAHAILYSYFFIKALRIRVPKPISMVITSIQLLEMLGGLFVILYTYYMRSMPGVGCCLVDACNKIALFIYFVYFVLFSNFFIHSYLLKKRSSLSLTKKAD